MPAFADRETARLINLLRRVEEAKAADLTAARRLFAAFCSELEEQIDHEERHLFPAGGEPACELAAVMRVEHRQLRRLLRDIGRKLFAGNGRTDAEQIVLAELLRSHRLREREAFPPKRRDV